MGGRGRLGGVYDSDDSDNDFYIGCQTLLHKLRKQSFTRTPHPCDQPLGTEQNHNTHYDYSTNEKNGMVQSSMSEQDEENLK